MARKFYRWVDALRRWVAEPYFAWLTIAVIAVALIVAFRNRDEATIRITGLILQLLGIATVAWGIYATRKFFGRPSVLTLFCHWFGRFPRFTGRTISASANIEGISLTLDASAYVWTNPGPQATIEERIKALEDNLHDVNKRLLSTQSDVNQRFHKLVADLEQEKNERTEADRETGEKLEATETGGLHISAMGLLWLFIGLIMSTMPTELVKLIK